MRDHAPVPFRVVVVDRAVPGSGTAIDLHGLTTLHTAWLRYVTGEAAGPPVTFGASLFTPDENAHMADVRRVFIAFRIAAVTAGLVGLVVVLRAVRRTRRATVALVRDAALVAAAAVTVIAVAAVVAFDPLFLLFHEVFFPGGNFLFPPDSNLLAMYPDEYWYGVTLRIGFTFAAAMGAIALAAAATQRQAHR